ncbi:MAG: right-handed parallel beta-helix repeat-containing protein, partial [Candidatus Odinarchaeota archaeon]
VKLKNGDYKTTINKCTFMNGKSDGVQLEDSMYRANITNSVFVNLDKDGLKGEVMALYVDNCRFENLGDEGIQMLEATLIAKNLTITDFDGTGIKADLMTGIVHIENVTITNGIDDAFQVSSGKEIVIKDSLFSGSDENGFETDHTGPITIENSEFRDNDIHGLELVNITDISITDSIIDGNSNYGIYASFKK